MSISNLHMGPLATCTPATTAEARCYMSAPEQRCYMSVAEQRCYMSAAEGWCYMATAEDTRSTQAAAERDCAAA